MLRLHLLWFGEAVTSVNYANNIDACFAQSSHVVGNEPCRTMKSYHEIKHWYSQAAELCAVQNSVMSGNISGNIGKVPYVLIFMIPDDSVTSLLYLSLSKQREFFKRWGLNCKIRHYSLHIDQNTELKPYLGFCLDSFPAMPYIHQAMTIITGKVLSNLQSWGWESKLFWFSSSNFWAVNNWWFLFACVFLILSILSAAEINIYLLQKYPGIHPFSIPKFKDSFLWGYSVQIDSM